MGCVSWKTSAIVLTLACVTILRSCEAQKVDLLSISETCAANFVTQDYQRDWEDKIYDGVWKVRMASKLHIFLMAHSMYETTNFRKFDNDHFQKSCFLTNRVNGWDITNTTGFGGKHVAMKLIRTTVPNTYRFVLPYGPFGIGSIGGTASVILSDNDLYTVFEYCFDNGLRTFAVISRNEISDKRDAIKLHLRSIGFKEKYIVDLKPNNECIEAGKNVLEPVDNIDLPEPGPRGLAFLTNAVYPLPPIFFKKK